MDLVRVAEPLVEPLPVWNAAGPFVAQTPVAAAKSLTKARTTRPIQVSRGRSADAFIDEPRSASLKWQPRGLEKADAPATKPCADPRPR
jgi:hypothetical protein